MIEAIARLAPPKRTALLGILTKLLDGLAEDPEAFAVERIALADKYGRVFMSTKDAAKLAAARKLLDEIATLN